MSNDTSHTNLMAAMAQLIDGYRATQLVRVLAEFRIADHLAEGPKSVDAIAQAESIAVDGISRILRLAASHGLVTSRDGVTFSGTPTLATLRSDAPASLRGYALTMGGPSIWLPWGRLTDAVRSGKPQSQAALGSDVWSYLAAHPTELADVLEALRGASAIGSKEVALAIDTSNVKLAIDVGGGNGSLLHALMSVNPTLRGVVLDRPNVVPSAHTELMRLGLQDRLTVVGGDFFESIPEGDLFLVRHILHDWNDADCLRILRNVRRAMTCNARVLIIEGLIGELGEPPAVPAMDVNMMVVLGGRERTLSEFQVMLRDVGLKVAKATAMRIPVAVIEAVAS